MSEREVDSFDEIKEQLIHTFYCPDGNVSKLASTIMTRMLIVGGYYSWAELVEFFIKHLQIGERTVPEDAPNKINPGMEQGITENSIEAIASFVEAFSKVPEEDTHYHQIKKLVPHIFKMLDLQHSEAIIQHAINAVNILLLT